MQVFCEGFTDHVMVHVMLQKYKRIQDLSVRCIMYTGYHPTEKYKLGSQASNQTGSSQLNQLSYSLYYLLFLRLIITLSILLL